MKGKDEVIQEFNELVNMTASELEKWLKSDDSNSAGWPKDSRDGESVGHDSGRKIVDILKDNPEKKPDKYTDEQIEHMRKVVSYCKRHLAQESATHEKKSTEEVKKTKSYASLKNWGHDILKKKHDKAYDKAKADDKADDHADESEEAEAGDKRSRQDGPTGDNKVRKTKKSSSAKDEKGQGDNGENDASADEDEYEEEVEQDDEKDEERKTRSKSTNGTNGTNGKKKDNQNGSKKSENNGDKVKSDKKSQSSGKSKNGEPNPGDTVSWNWGQGQPQGKVLEVKHDKASVTTKRGNQVSRDGSVQDPAIILDTGKSKAIKLNHELN